MTWDGRERRERNSELQGRRDPDDRHCTDHFLMWEYHDKEAKDHRQGICGSLTRIESDHKEDIHRLETELLHKAEADDIERVKVALVSKAEHKDLKATLRMVSILIAIACTIIAGQAIWLKSDISSLSSGIQRLNQRVSDNINDRVSTDIEQTKSLEQITGQLGIISWRLKELEDSHKAVNTK